MFHDTKKPRQLSHGSLTRHSCMRHESCVTFCGNCSAATGRGGTGDDDRLVEKSACPTSVHVPGCFGQRESCKCKWGELFTKELGGSAQKGGRGLQFGGKYGWPIWFLIQFLAHSRDSTHTDRINIHIISLATGNLFHHFLPSACLDEFGWSRTAVHTGNMLYCLGYFPRHK